MARPATPAAPERPRSGARAKARPPKNRAMKPTHRAKPTEERGGIGSPSDASPYRFELTVVANARMTRARASIVRCAASFSSAILRLPNGAAATKSRLPRRASPASVDERARIDQSAVPRAKMAPYFQLMYPPSVPSFSGFPNRLTIDAGMLPMSLSTSRRVAGVGKTLETATPMTRAIPPSRPAAMMKARRESRIVLP